MKNFHIIKATDDYYESERHNISGIPTAMLLGPVLPSTTFTPPFILPPVSTPPPSGVPHFPSAIIPVFYPPFGGGNHSTPRIFHGIGGDPVFTSGGATGNGKPCSDLNGRTINSGLHYIPGPDECTLCVCEDGMSKWCKAVLCSPPTDCKSFRVGSSCCDFICLDDSLNKGGGGQKTGGPFNGGPLDLADVVPKIIVVIITTILSMSLLLFLIHRLRQKQIQGRLNSAVARRCTGIDDCEDGGSLDFSMDFFDRGPPPPHYLSWWKPPSYFPPRGEAPPSYSEAIASTSNCLPATFTAIYNNNANNNAGIPPPMGEFGTGNNSAALPNQASAHSEDEIATTILSTTPTVEPQLALNNESASCSSAIGNNCSDSAPSNSSGCRRLFSKPKRFHSVGNNCARTSRSETEHLRRIRGGRDTGQHRSTSESFRHPVVVGFPLGSSSSSGTSASGSLHPLTYPPPYPHYGEELLRHGRNPYLLRQSFTLPRHRTEYFGGRPGILATLPQLSQGQVDRVQQRLSLPGGGTAGWSSASSSTLSLSTPNSPNDVIGGVGRPPSLSSSSSNVSEANIQL